MIINRYLGKFSEVGKPEGFLLEGINYKTQAEKDGYLAQGYVELTQEEWEYYTNNRGPGDNGTGYYRDPVTGQPVSAPARVWTKTELSDMAYSNCTYQVNAINQEILLAQSANDTETVQELNDEKDEIEKIYAQQLEDIENGVITEPSRFYYEEEQV